MMATLHDSPVPLADQNQVGTFGPLRLPAVGFFNLGRCR